MSIALIPAHILLPHQRLPHLLEQAKAFQRLQCVYHVATPHISLLADHSCGRFTFPIQTSHVLAQHSDEVWRIEWSHDGTRLATAGRDTQCIIWKLSSAKGHPQEALPRKAFQALHRPLNLSESPSTRAALWRGLSSATRSTDGSFPMPSLTGVPLPAYDERFCPGYGEVTVEVDYVLDGHPAGINCIAWSPDDSVLLTGSDCTIKMWNTRVSGEEEVRKNTHIVFTLY